MSAIEERRVGKHVFRHRSDSGAYVDQMGYSEWLGEYCVGPMADGEEPRMRSFDRSKALLALRTGTCTCGVHLYGRENHRCGEDVALYAELSVAAFQQFGGGVVSAPLERDARTDIEDFVAEWAAKLPQARFSGSTVDTAMVSLGPQELVGLVADAVAAELRRAAQDVMSSGFLTASLRVRARADEIEATS